MNNEVTPGNIQEMLDLVKADKDARAVFLTMPRDEQLLAMLGMISFLSMQIANMQRETIEYRNTRERKEDEHGQRAIDTGTKIAQGIQSAMSQKFDRWQKLADSILDKVITLVIIGILYLVFGGQLP